MKMLSAVWRVIPVTLALSLFGCTDHPTATDLSPAPGLSVVEWREPVGREIVARQLIGPAGGVIELRGTGVEIRFPEGAVSERVLIEARALEGSAVAFELEVGGLTLGVPIEIRIASGVIAGEWFELLGIFSSGDSPSEVTLPGHLDEDSVVIEIGVNIDTPLSVVVQGHAVASG